MKTLTVKPAQIDMDTHHNGVAYSAGPIARTNSTDVPRRATITELFAGYVIDEFATLQAEIRRVQRQVNYWKAAGDANEVKARSRELRELKRDLRLFDPVEAICDDLMPGEELDFSDPLITPVYERFMEYLP